MITALASLARLLPENSWKSKVGVVFARASAPLGVNPVAEAKLDDGSILLLDARSRTEAHAIWNGCYDRDDTDFFKVCVSMGGNCLDIGANVGLVAIPLALQLRHSSGRKVIAFEPVRSNFERLQANIQLNGLATTLSAFDVALGDSEGEIEIALETGGGASTGNAVISRALNDLSQFTVMKARITRLDTHVKENPIGPVGFIKIDVEGAELLCLRGAQSVIRDSRPIVYGEFHSEFMPKFGHTFVDVAAFFAPFGYRAFAFGGRLLPVEITTPKPGIGNVFFVPNEKVEELLKRLAHARGQ